MNRNRKKIKKGKQSIRLAFVRTNLRRGKCPEESSGTRVRHEAYESDFVKFAGSEVRCLRYRKHN